MTISSLFEHRNGVYYLQNAIDFNTAPAWLEASNALFASTPNGALVLNFADLQPTTNSAALALIIEWLKLAARYHIKLRFDAFPNTLLSIATVSGLTELMQECLCA